MTKKDDVTPPEVKVVNTNSVNLDEGAPVDNFNADLLKELQDLNKKLDSLSSEKSEGPDGQKVSIARLLVDAFDNSGTKKE